MSSEKVIVTVEFASAKDARHMAQVLRDEGHEFLPKQIEAALPPEYIRGLAYRITEWGRGPVIGFYDGERFVIPADPTGSTSFAGYSRREAKDLQRVEPLRVLGDDEIAVKRSPNDRSANWRAVEANARRDGFSMAASAAKRIGDALDAEARP